MIRMTDRLRIQTLREAGRSVAEVAAQVGVSPRSVKRIAAEPAIASVDAAPTPASRGVGRPSKVAAFRSFVGDLIESEPTLPTVEVLHRLRCAGYDGGKSAVYDLVKSLRPKRQGPPMVRFEGLPGEFSQHGYCPETRHIGSTSHCLQRDLRLLAVSARSRHPPTGLTRPARTSATVVA